VTEHGAEKEEIFHMVDCMRANVVENRIPPDNPLGRALLGAKPGDIVEYEAPKGRVKCWS